MDKSNEKKNKHGVGGESLTKNIFERQNKETLQRTLQKMRQRPSAASQHSHQCQDEMSSLSGECRLSTETNCSSWECPRSDKSSSTIIHQLRAQRVALLRVTLSSSHKLFISRCSVMMLHIQLHAGAQYLTVLITSERTVSVKFTNPPLNVKQ